MSSIRIYFILLMLFAGVQNVISQEKNTVYGNVRDTETHQPVSFANVTLTTQNTNHRLIGTVTQDDGLFMFENVPQGEYCLTISFVGYKSFSRNLHIGTLTSNYNLGKMELHPDAQLLGEVNVVAKKSTVSAQLEKKSFNIADNLSQGGGSVLEAMRNLPGVSVDQDGKVLLRGSDKVSVLIDGKQSSLTGFGNQKSLDNIPSAHIERIEIINNPSAKYQANGMAGIINIIYKKNIDKGLNGDVGFSFGLGELSTRKDNLPDIMDKLSFTPKYNPALSLNYRTNKINLFIQSAAMFRKKQNSNEFTSRVYNDGNDNINSQFLENRTQQEYNIKGGMDWYIDNQNQLTIYGLFEDEYHIDRGAVPYDYAASGERKRLWGWAEDERTWSMNYVMEYTHKFTQPGHTLAASFLYKHGVEDELFPFTDKSATRNSADSTHLIDKEKIATFKVDYTRPLLAGRIEAGTNIQLRNIPISYRIMQGKNSILDNNLGSWSKYKENVYALYLNYLFESKYIDIEAGVRMEYATIKYDIDPQNKYYPRNESYNEWPVFPNVRFTIKANERNKISLFYNRRVDRPGEFELRPFPKYDDPEILKTGNPYLRPQYTQNAEISYKTSWNTGSVFVSGYYKKITDIISRIYTTSANETDVVNSIPQNLKSGHNIGTEIIVEQRILPAWSVNGSFNWYRNVINAFSGTALYPYSQPFEFDKTSNNTWNLKINSTLTLPRVFDVQCSYAYYAPNIIPQGRVKRRSTFDVGMRKKMLKDRLELSLAATDLFNTFGLKQEINGKNFNMTSNNYYETQVVTIGMKYKF